MRPGRLRDHRAALLQMPAQHHGVKGVDRGEFLGGGPEPETITVKYFGRSIPED
jgi:hypothetical protein